MNGLDTIRVGGALLVLAAGLATPATASSKDRTVLPLEGGVIVAYDDDADADARLAARRSVAVRRVRTLRVSGGTYELVTSGGDARRTARSLERVAGVAFAEPDGVVRIERTPNDPRFGELPGMQKIRAPLAWDSVTGDRVTVAVADSGVTLTHPDLRDNGFVNGGESGDGKETNGVDDDRNGFVDDVTGWDFYYDGNDASDNEDHGTHVAGTIAAKGDNGLGVAGVAWNARILPLAFIGPDGSGATSAAAEALDYAGRMGAKVVNGSFSSGTPNALVTRAISAHPETLYVFAAGNDGSSNEATPRYPCSYDLPNALCVAAIDDDGGLADFSNYGGRRVHLAAPGVQVLSTIPADGYGRKDGTSMAAPHVSGAAVLLATRYPWANVARLRAALLAGVAKNAALTGMVSTGGHLDVPGALAAAADTVAPSAPALGPLPAVSASPQPAVTWTPATDADSGVSRYELLDGPEKIAGSDRGDGTQPGPWTRGLPDGVHALTVRAVDREGNVTSSAPANLRVDTLPPTAPAITVRNRWRRPGPMRVTWNAAADAGPISRYEVYLDGKLAQQVPGNALFGRVVIDRRDRATAIAVAAVDEAGHRGAVATKAITVDATRPKVRMRIRARLRRLRSRRGQTVTCRANEAVTCTASIVLRPREKRRARARSARIAGPVQLRDRGNRIHTGRLKLSRRGRSALRRLGSRPRVQLVVVAEDRAGNRAAARRIVRLR